MRREMLESKSYSIIPLTAKWALRALINYTLSNARRFYSSMENPSAGKGLFESAIISELDLGVYVCGHEKLTLTYSNTYSNLP